MAATPSVAGPAVINTAELREMILLEMDNRTLLLSQRVSRNFKATIDQSHELQVKLFFAQDFDVPSLATRMREQSQAIYSFLFQPAKTTRNGAKATYKSILLDNARFKGFGILDPHHLTFRGERRIFQLDLHFHLYPLKDTHPILPKASTGEESWRKMYMFRPGFAAGGSNFERSQNCTMQEYLDGYQSSENWEKGPFRLACGIECIRNHGETYDNVDRWLKNEDCMAWDQDKGRELQLQAQAERRRRLAEVEEDRADGLRET